MTAVEITNLSKATFVFTLYHDVFCKAATSCKCKVDDVLRSVEGGLKYTKVITPASVYLDPGTTIQLEDSVKNIPQVTEATKRGILKVKVVELIETLDPSRRT